MDYVRLKNFNSIYFGSAGDPGIPDHITLWGLRLKICQGLDQYANLRPVRLLPGISSPLKDISEKDIDWAFIRENSEGEIIEKIIPTEIIISTTTHCLFLKGSIIF